MVKQKDKQYTSRLLPPVARQSPIYSPKKDRWWVKVARFILRHGFRLFAILFAFTMIGRNSETPTDIVAASIHQTVAGWGFDLIEWEVDSSSAKLGLLFDNPTLEMAQTESSELVLAYMDRSRQIVEIEEQFKQSSISTDSAAASNISILQQPLDSLRAEQDAERSFVESIIQQQIGTILVNENISIANRPFPPVLFSFTEPPKRLTVSSRHSIETVYVEMLDAAIDLETIEASEKQIFEDENLSAYITNIGGLGAFPTMVIDRASLRWILSTVAHEWSHNYLALYPLGIRYGQTPEITILNETVADIVGDEIGDKALVRYYPHLVPSAPTVAPDVSGGQSLEQEEIDPKPFDFRAEMRETRLIVDEMLAEGLVEEAELYMEVRRLDFVENGYPLRVLNQAYFAFHGNYGTSAASSSPIGPKLEMMREQSHDLVSFLEKVRWFDSVEDIDMN